MGDRHFEFGGFRLYPSEQLLLRENEPIPLAPKAFELLVTLVAGHGRLMTRETLMTKVWPDSFVEETNLTANISLLRKALGDGADGRIWIATVPKRGYRFDGLVTEHAEADAESGVQSEAVLRTATRTETAPIFPSSPASSVEAPPLAGAGLDPVPAVTATEMPTVAAAGWPTVSNLRPRRRWLYAAALSALVSLSAGFYFWRMRPSSQLATVHTIAVLPFQTTASNAEDQYLGIGLTDALITRLGKLSQIVVRPIGAVRSIPSSGNPVEAGKQLDVQAVLNGTIARAGDHTQVEVTLRRVSDGHQMWTDKFEEQNSSDFQIEDSISERLAKALTLRLSQEEQRHLTTPDTPSSQAYALYTQGRYYWNQRSVDSVQKSIDLFRQATELDPRYTAAWSGLADAWILAGSYGNSFLAPSVAMPKAKEAAEKALALDDSSAEAHTSLAYIHLMWDWDFAAAEQEFNRAIESNPGYVNAHHWYSHELIALGRTAESHEESEKALGLDPTDVVINEHMAWHHMMTREYDRSLPQAYKAVELDPKFVQAHRVLALDLLYTGRAREACAEFEKGVELSHGDPVANAYLARCYALTHREVEARKILAALEGDAGERYISAAEIAAVYAALNDAGPAMKWLEKAYDERAGVLVYLNADRVWDPLRGNAAFQALAQRMKLPAIADETGDRSEENGK